MTIRAALLRAIGRTETVLAVKAPLPDTYEPDLIRLTLEEALFDAFMGYASASGPVTKWRNAAGRAVTEAVADAAYRGIEDGGADETDDDDERWITRTQGEQRDFLPGVFEWIKAAKADETITEDAIRARVEQWAQTLDAIYSEGVLRGKKNQVFIWHLGETEAHCTTCAKLDGQRHKAAWYLERNYIPGKPGSDTECGGWRCLCYLTNKAGETVTL